MQQDVDHSVQGINVILQKIEQHQDTGLVDSVGLRVVRVQ
jgi:hypothetical protein